MSSVLFRDRSAPLSCHAHWCARSCRATQQSNRKEWTFAANGYGKPEIANASRGTQQITFDISHTRSLILLGITAGSMVGVDVENCWAREPPLKIANRFFAPGEPAEFQALPRAQQHGRFSQPSATCSVGRRLRSRD
jgi:phosphopantetheinyl transferase